MGDNSKIEWTDATWNPTTGCSKVSQGCKNCYALRDWPRLAANPKSVYYQREFTDVQYHADRLDQPLRWRDPRMIFVNSMSDLFHEKIPDAFIDQVFAVMASADRHTFQVLTKRPERMADYMHDLYAGRMYEVAALKSGVGYTPMVSFAQQLPNVWLGTSVENQETANERIPLLMDTDATIRFLSCEPLLGEIDLAVASNEWQKYIDWVIVGGESGPKARPMEWRWAARLRNHCCLYGVAFHFKQWGEHNAQGMRVGKRAAGRLLDGREWNEFPEVRRA